MWYECVLHSTWVSTASSADMLTHIKSLSYLQTLQVQNLMKDSNL